MHVPSKEALIEIDRAFKYAPELRAAVNQQTDFLSSREKFETLSEDDFTANGSDAIPAAFKGVAHLKVIDDERYLDPINEEPILLELANDKGQLAVGDQLLTVRHEKFVLIPLVDAKEFGSNPEDHREAVTYYQTTKTKQPQSLTLKGNIGACEPALEFGPSRKGRRRLRGEIEENSGVRGLVSDDPVLKVRARNKFYRRGSFGIWYGERADNMRHAGTLSFGSSGTFGEAIDEDCNNCQSFNTLFETEGPVERFFGGITHFVREGSSLEDCDSTPERF